MSVGKVAPAVFAHARFLFEQFFPGGEDSARTRARTDRNALPGSFGSSLTSLHLHDAVGWRRQLNRFIAAACAPLPSQTRPTIRAVKLCGYTQSFHITASSGLSTATRHYCTEQPVDTTVLSSNFIAPQGGLFISTYKPAG